ncbi:MAG: dGTPase [Acidimicrobiales bacterium]|nr:dGTPase [Acidimicrobiales bacterium]
MLVALTSRSVVATPVAVPTTGRARTARWGGRGHRAEPAAGSVPAVARRKQTPADVKVELLDFALTLPGTFVDHPWGDTVVKVNKKIFVFLGSDDPQYQPGIGVKLVDSHEQALQAPGASPSGYGLGKAGWVSVPLTGTPPPVGVLTDWIEESYRLVALKRLVKELDERGAG